MSVDRPGVQCSDCGIELSEEANHATSDRKPCPNCGSIRRTIRVSIHDTITFKSKVGVKGRRGGRGKPFIEHVFGDDLNVRSGKWMKLTRFIDRENDLYHESVVDPATGEMVRECREPLSQHQNHGAAKKRPKNEDANS